MVAIVVQGALTSCQTMRSGFNDLSQELTRVYWQGTIMNIECMLQHTRIRVVYEK